MSEAPRSLKGNLLNARDRLGDSIIEIVAADLAVHGPQVIAALRQQNPVAYARLVSDLVHFKKLATERGPKKNPGTPQRKRRPLRMKELLKAMDDQPIDVNSPILPPKHRERWLAAEEALWPRTAWDLTPEELQEAWGADLADWWERHLRAPRPAPARRRMVPVRYHMKIKDRPTPSAGRPRGAGR